MRPIRCAPSARNVGPNCRRLQTVEHVLNGVDPAAFEEFAGIWQRLLMHQNGAGYFRRACMPQTALTALLSLYQRNTRGSAMHFDPVLLSRIQFAWVVAWHILLPAFTVGCASFIAVVEGIFFATGREEYARISTFWTKIFAIAFGMGVVTGLVMPFQFGTNWSRYAAAASDVLSPLFAYEGLTAFFLEAGFAVLGVGAYLLRRNRSVLEARTMMSMALWMLTVLVPLQMVIGDMHGLNTRKYQPAKLAAIEARWDTGKGVPLTVFAIPDDKNEQNKFAIEIPFLGSMILTHDVHGEVKGLKDFPADQRPPVAIPFFAFRAMVGCAGLMLALVLLGGWLRWNGRLYDTRLYLLACQCAIPLGFIAVVAGWFVTEVGRQPWTVYGLLRTADSVTPSLTGADVTLSLLAYMAVYLLIYPCGVILLARLVRKGPLETSEAAPSIEAGIAAAPVIAHAINLAKGEVP